MYPYTRTDIKKDLNKLTTAQNNDSLEMLNKGNTVVICLVTGNPGSCCL